MRPAREPALGLQQSRVPCFCLQAAAAAVVDDWRSLMSSTVGAVMAIAANDRTAVMEMSFILTERRR